MTRHPIELSREQTEAIQSATSHVHPRWKDRFLAQVADAIPAPLDSTILNMLIKLNYLAEADLLDRAAIGEGDCSPRSNEKEIRGLRSHQVGVCPATKIVLI